MLPVAAKKNSPYCNHRPLPTSNVDAYDMVNQQLKKDKEDIEKTLFATTVTIAKGSTYRPNGWRRDIDR